MLVWLPFLCLATVGGVSSQADRWNPPEPSAEEVPGLLAKVAEQQEGWGFADLALGRSRDPRIVPSYIDLLKNNFYAKESDGTRKQYGLGSRNGCLVMPFYYGAMLARRLGQAGDSRAIPVLQEAVKQGEEMVATDAYRALYKLRALQLDDLFELARNEPRPRLNIPALIVEIGWASIHLDARAAIAIFDRVIAELPQHAHEVAAAHYWKIQCFEILGQHADALHEVDEVLLFPQFAHLTGQMQERRLRLEALLKTEHSRP